MGWALLPLLTWFGYCSSTCTWAFRSVATISIPKTDAEPGVASISCPWTPVTVPIPTSEICLAYGTELFRSKFALVIVMVFPWAKFTTLGLSAACGPESMCQYATLFYERLAQIVNIQLVCFLDSCYNRSTTRSLFTVESPSCNLYLFTCSCYWSSREPAYCASRVK